MKTINIEDIEWHLTRYEELYEFVEEISTLPEDRSSEYYKSYKLDAQKLLARFKIKGEGDE